MTMQLLAELPPPLGAGIISIAIRNGPSQRTFGIGAFLRTGAGGLLAAPFAAEGIGTQ